MMLELVLIVKNSLILNPGGSCLVRPGLVIVLISVTQSLISSVRLNYIPGIHFFLFFLLF